MAERAERRTEQQADGAPERTKVPMVYLSIMVDESDKDAIRDEARRRGVAMADVAREWMERGRPAGARTAGQVGE